MLLRLLVFSVAVAALLPMTLRADNKPGAIAPKPLFRDPIEDGAADPTIIWNAREKKWFIFYTNRRAKTPASETPGVTWVHGTRIGIAESSDQGATWKYRGIAEIGFGDEKTTHWAPEVIEHDGTYHMFLTIVPGIFTDWNHPRDIIHLSSDDLLKWKYESTLKLASDRVIDPCVRRLPDGTWRMWYNNESDHKSIYYADSSNLKEWKDIGKAVGDQAGEGPQVFQWKGHWWMIVDVWKGLGVYRSDDATKWSRQKSNLLQEPGKGEDDGAIGQHPGVDVCNDRAYLFYFTHPGRANKSAPRDSHEFRRSSLQVVELEYKDGWLTCDRDQPTHILLTPPAP
jgi:hypothetical protein